MMTRKTFTERGINSFPLHWPVGWKRTTRRERGRFKNISFANARDQLFIELGRMGVRNWNVVLSSNISLRRDGLPYSGQSNPSDPGVAVYFVYKDKDMVFACDTYLNVTYNLWAIRKTIEALRGIQRWGASDMMERSFTGFAALPEASKKEWWDVLEVNRSCTVDTIKNNYRRLAKQFHPDIEGGSEEKMAELNIAYKKALENVNKNL